MGTIVVCCKWALDISALPAGFPERAYPQDWENRKISDFDLQALRQGVRLREQTGWSLTAVTCGAGISAALRDILSRGPERIAYVDDPTLAQADSRSIAKVLAALIKEIPDVKLVLCGEGSSDHGSRQIGPRLAVLLGYQCLTYVSEIEAGAGNLQVTRNIQGEKEVYAAGTPLVLSISGGLTEPDLPGIKDIMEAGSKPARAFSLEELGLAGSSLEAEKLPVELRSYSQRRRGIKLDSTSGSQREIVCKLVKILSREGILGLGGEDHDLGDR